MRRVRRRWATVAGVLAALLAALPASAAFERAPVDLGPGDGNSPSVAIDPAGTAHVVWGIAEDVMGYCALPRGARSCAASARLSLDARAGRPEILRRAQDGLLIVVAGRDDFDSDPDESVWAFTSADGVTWAGPVQIGLGIGEFDAAALTADGAAVDLLESDTGVNDFQRAPVAGPPTASVLNLATTPAGTTTAYDYPGDLVRMRSGATLALLGSPADGFAYRVLTRRRPVRRRLVEPVAREARDDRVGRPARRLGPARHLRDVRVHVLDQVYGAAPQVVRRLRGTRWARPRGLFYEVNANTTNTALAQDARRPPARGDRRHRRQRPAHAASPTRARAGTAGSPARSRSTRPSRTPSRPGRVRLAVDPRGRGVVAWATTGDALRVAPAVARAGPGRHAAAAERTAAAARRSRARAMREADRLGAGLLEALDARVVQEHAPAAGLERLA